MKPKTQFVDAGTSGRFRRCIGERAMKMLCSYRIRFRANITVFFAAGFLRGFFAVGLVLGTGFAAAPAVPANPNPGSAGSPGPNLSGNTVTLSWGAVSGATYYDLGVRDIASGNLAVNTTTSANSYTATLAPGKQYRWNVAAGNASGLSAYTSVLYFQTPAAVVLPATPGNPAPGAASSPGPTLASNAVTLSWGAVSGATSYELGVRDVASGNLVVNASTSATSYTATLTAGKQYRWNVAAANTAGLSAYTAVLYFQTPVPPVAAPAISGMTPTTMPAANGNQLLTISGSNFQAAATLTFGAPTSGAIPSTGSKLTFVSSGQLTYQFNNGGEAGRWTVKVNNPDGKSSAAVSFSVTAPPPALPNLVPQAIVLGKNSLEAGGTLAVNWNLANTGGGGAPATMTGVRITTSSTSPAGATLTNVNTPALAAGAIAPQSAKITAPASPGTYYVWILADNVANSTLQQADVTDDYQRSAAFTVVAPAAALSFIGLSPATFTTGAAGYQASTTASGSNFNNVTKVAFAWTGATTGTATWNKGDASWNARATLDSDAALTLRPVVTAAGDPAGTTTWTVTLTDSAGATKAQTFTVAYTPATAPAGAAEYPGATWQPAPTANYGAANRAPADVRWIVIHTTEGTTASAVQRFTNPAELASAHYLVSRDGSIIQFVQNKDVAYAAGNLAYNNRSINIEHERYGTNNWTEAQFAASTNLVKWLLQRYNVVLTFPTGIAPANPASGSGIIGHVQVPDPNDPNKPGGANGRTDPVNWDWARYRELLGVTPGAQTYAITMSAAPSVGGTASGGGTKTASSNVTVIAVANTGFRFVNWTEGGAVLSTSASYAFAAAANRSLVANFAAVASTITIAVVPSPLAGGAVRGPGAIASGASATVSATAEPGYTFLNWTENDALVTNAASFSFTASRDRKLAANFATAEVLPGAFDLLADAPLWDSAAGVPNVRLSWSSSSGTGYYEVYRNGQPYATGLAASVTSFVDRFGLETGKTYDYQVVARNPTGERRTSSVRVAIPDTLRPGRPDLTVDQDSLAATPATVAAQGVVTFRFSVRNRGQTTAPAGARLLVSLRAGSGAGALDAAVFAAGEVGALAPGESQAITMVQSLPVGTPAGRYYLTVLADSEKVLNDADLSNNRAISATALLEITARAARPLVITKQPKVEPVLENGEVALTVEATGEGPLRYQWFRDQEAIQGTDPTKPTLNLLALRSYLLSRFWVRVTDAASTSLDSDQVALAINLAPETVTPERPEFELIFEREGVVVTALDRTLPTMVITHGWQPLPKDSYQPGKGKVALPDWMEDLSKKARDRLGAKKINVVYVHWRAPYLNPAERVLFDTAIYVSGVAAPASAVIVAGVWGTSLARSGAQAFGVSEFLVNELKAQLGSGYRLPLHLIGHSMGTAVNAQAASLLSGYANVQVTLLDTPTRFAGYDEEFYRGMLPRGGGIGFVDNYYGSGLSADFPFFAVGGPIFQSENWEFPNVGHSGVHARYREIILNDQGAQVPSWRNVLRDGFVVPLAWGAISSDDAAATRTLANLEFSIPLDTRVVGTTSMVRGQMVAGYVLSSQARTQPSARDAVGARSPAADTRAAVVSASPPEISRDLAVVAEATHLRFDLLVAKPGAGSWVSVTFNDAELLTLRDDSFSGDEFRTFTLPFAAYAGKTGPLKFILRGDASDNAEIVVANIRITTSEAPVWVTQPSAQAVNSGDAITLTTQAGGRGPLGYQWRKDGAPIAGATAATLTVAGARPADAGSYDVVVTNATAAITSAVAVITVVVPAEVSRISNLSIRTSAGTGSQTLIVGLVVGGAGTSGSKQVLLRGVGPSLAPFGVTNLLADPKMTVFSGAVVTEVNDDWGGTAAIAQAMTAVGAFPFVGATSKDAAINGSVTAGSYTIQITGAGGGTGTVLAEIYDATPEAAFAAATPRLLNVSARTQVGTGGDILITGLVVAGTAPKTILVRASGPALTPFGVTGVLADPTLTVFQGATPLGTNDNWSDAGNAAAIAAAATRVGAFALPVGGKDAAALITLKPGSYTVQVSGVGGTTGVALVEVYEVP